MIQIAKEDGATNLADVLTKSLPVPQLRDLIGQILYWARSFAFHGTAWVPPATLRCALSTSRSMEMWIFNFLFGWCYGQFSRIIGDGFYFIEGTEKIPPWVIESGCLERYKSENSLILNLGLQDVTHSLLSPILSDYNWIYSLSLCVFTQKIWCMWKKMVVDEKFWCEKCVS